MNKYLASTREMDVVGMQTEEGCRAVGGEDSFLLHTTTRQIVHHVAQLAPVLYDAMNT